MPESGAETRDRRAAGGGDADSTGIGQTLRDSTYRSIDEQKTRASDTLGSLAGAVRGMTQPLRDGGQSEIASYVNRAADGIERWASQLRQQDLEEAIRGVERFARRQPVMFLGIAFGAGLIAARFLKSSSPHSAGRYGSSFDSMSGDRSSGFGASGPGAMNPGFGAGTPRPAYGTSTSGPGGSSTGDIPRVSSDIRPTGEVL
jgi:hypothetical protein